MLRLRRSLVVAAQVALAAVVFGYAAVTLRDQWQAIGEQAASLRLDWGLVALSGAIVLATYGLLVETWRRVVLAWGFGLSWATAARIWFVSNLGKYVPGKVWVISAMGVMAERAGVSAVAASGSSVVIQLVNVISGFAVVVATGARALLPRGAAFVIVALGGALVLIPYGVPVATRVIARITGREIALPTLPLSAFWIGALGCTAGWVLYGAAFEVLARAVIPGATGTLASYTAAYTASYLIGFLAVFAPGGLGVRETLLLATLPQLGLMTRPEAALLAVVSRLWLTVLEITPGAFFLVRDALRGSRGGMADAP